MRRLLLLLLVTPIVCWAQGGGVNFPSFNIVAPSSGECLVFMGNSSGGVWINSSCSGTASTAFSSLTGSTNTQAAMIVGSGASLSYSGSGGINASEIVGLSFPSLVSGDCLSNNGTSLSWSSCGSGSMVYPGAGIPNSTGSAWGTSYSTTGSGNVVLSTSPTLTTPNLGMATAPGLTLSAITGSTQCLHVNTSGVVSGTGTDCGSGGGSGTVNSGTSGQLAYYPSTGTAVSGETTLTAAQLGAANAVLADIQANTTFTVAGTGCTPSAHAGGPFGGTVTLASGPCTALVITINGATGFTAPTGYHCNVGDRTAMAAGNDWIPSWTESASTTTAATLPIPAAAGATDVISFSCSYF